MRLTFSTIIHNIIYDSDKVPLDKSVQLGKVLIIKDIYLSIDECFRPHTVSVLGINTIRTPVQNLRVLWQETFGETICRPTKQEDNTSFEETHGNLRVLWTVLYCARNNNHTA